MTKKALIAAVVLFVLCGAGLWYYRSISQRADSGFDTRVANPSYTEQHPRVLFDEAHHNASTANGRYKPFVELMRNDGYRIARNKEEITTGILRPYQILTIVNAMGPRDRKIDPAFTDKECEAIQSWVRDGGSLLLITDHFPIGSANEILANRFGIQMSKGETSDPAHYVSSFSADQSVILFSRNDGMLGQHPILEGRSPAERIDRVMVFTGQSILGPSGSTQILKLSDAAKDMVPVNIRFEKKWYDTVMITTFSDPVPANGRALAVAFEYGNGRVVVTGEAAMFTAQVLGKEHFGMNYPGNDNRQLAFNVMHWLSRLL